MEDEELELWLISSEQLAIVVADHLTVNDGTNIAFKAFKVLYERLQDLEKRVVEVRECKCTK